MPAARSRCTRGPCRRPARSRWRPNCWADYTPASQAVSRAEVQIQIQAALNGMDPIDREIIALRHFEELTNAEVAEVLGLETSTASKRYIRALKRLQVVLEHIPGLLDRVR